MPDTDLTRSTLDILAKLVSFDTTSHKTNIPLIDWVEDFLKPYGGRITRIPSPIGEPKVNLYVSFGPLDKPGYILSGHTDVVPVTGQDWSSDPFTLTRKGDRVYGRGSTDMKGFLACCLAAVPKIAQTPLAAPIHFAFSYDEEVGMAGAKALADYLAAQDIKPLGAFIGEPSSMQVIIGHKGAQRVWTTVNGKTCHSSLAPQGVNSVEWGARLIAFIRDIADRTTEKGLRDEMYDVPHTTLHTGIFNGGTAGNIVPHEAKFTFEIRAIGGESTKPYLDEILAYAREKLEPRMKAVDPDAGFHFEISNGLPALETAPEAEVTVLAKKLAGRNDHAKVAYGTEASIFQITGGVPSIVVGPGDIDQAHKADEFIDIAELERCNKFIDNLIAHCRA